MSFDWSKFVELAENLSKNQSEDAAYQEAIMRAAISRAYYGAFCSARNFARDEETFSPLGDGSDHARLQSYFSRTANNATDKIERAVRSNIALDLKRLHDNRKLADYNDKISGLIAINKASITLAKNIIQGLAELMEE